MDYILHLDQQLFLFLNGLGTETWDGVWIFITNKWASIPVYVILTFLLYRKIGLLSTLYVLIGAALLIGFTDQFSNVLKHGFQRVRPCHLDIPSRFIAPRCGKYGFPSAHALNSMALAIFIGNILKPYYKHIIKILLFWSLLLGLSRVYVGVHYPVDILCGFIIGALVGNLSYKIYKYRQENTLRAKADQKMIIQEFGKSGLFFFKNMNLILAAFVLVSLILYLRSEVYDNLFILEDTAYEIYYEMFAVFLSFIGFCQRLYTVGFTSRDHSAANRERIKLYDSLNPFGVYAELRKFYLAGNFLILLGLVMWTGNFWFIGIYCLLYWIPFRKCWFTKNKMLNDEVERVNISVNHAKKCTTFNWLMALQKEKGILLSLFLVFCFFNLFGEVIEDAQEMNTNYFLWVMALISVTNFFVIKFIFKKKAQEEAV